MCNPNIAALLSIDADLARLQRQAFDMGEALIAAGQCADDTLPEALQTHFDSARAALSALLRELHDAAARQSCAMPAASDEKQSAGEGNSEHGTE